jgi:hypothetical protein
MEALYNGCEVVSTQSLSMNSIPRLYVESSSKDLAKKMNELLNASKPAERVIFNTMNDSVNNMLGLFECD